MAAEKLRFEVEVDADRGVAQIVRTGKALDAIGSTGETSAKRTGRALDDLGGSIFKINQLIDFTKRAFHALSTPIEKIINVGAKFETIELQLQTILGSADKAKEYFEWLMDFSAHTPFRIEGLSESVIMLESFGINSKEYLQTFGDAASALQIPLNDLSRVMGQIWSKPNAQMEEMLQLIERGVPVAKILQDQMGLTAEQVANIGREGIRGQEVFEALARGMQDMYGGAMQKFSGTWTGMVSTLMDQVDLFLGKVAGPVMENLKGRLEDLLGKIDQWAKDGTLDKIAGDIADFISGAIETIADIGKFLWDYKEEIIALAKVFAAIWAVDKINKFGSSLMGLINNVSSGIGTLKSGIGGLSGMMGKLGLAAGAAFAGWKAGEWINDILGLQKAEAQLYEWELKLEYAISANKTGLTEYAQKNALLNEKIRALGHDLGVTSNSIYKCSEAIFKNTEAFMNLDPEIQKIIEGYLNQKAAGIEVQKTLEEQRKATEALEKAKEEERKKQEALLAAQEEARKARELETRKIQELADKLKLTGSYKSELEEKTRLLLGAIRLANPEWEKNAASVEEVEKFTKDLISQYQFAGIDIPESLSKIQIALQLTKDKQEEWDKEAEESFKNLADSLDTSVEHLGYFQGETNLTTQSLKAGSDMTCNLIDKFKALEKPVNISQQAFSGARGIISELGIEVSEGLGHALDAGEKGLDAVSKFMQGDFVGAAMAAISAVISLGKAIICWFSGDGIQEAIDRENAWMNLNESLTESIYDLAEALGVHASTSLHMVQILQESLSLENFDQYADRVREIQCDVLQGTLSQEEANQAMGESFEILAQKAREYGKEGTFYMLQLIRQNRDMGLNIAEINDYVLSKLDSGIKGLETYMNTLQGSFSENAVFIEANLLSLFGALEQEGYSFLEIVNMMSGSLSQIAEKAAIEGVEISGAILEMIDLSEFIAENEALIQNIEATQQIMTALGDSAYLSQESFTAFGQEALKQFDALLAAGAKEKDALRILGPELIQLIKYAESYGYAIEGETAALIEKAKTEGALNAQSMSDSEKQIMLMEEIVRLLGGEIPYHLGALTSQVTDSVDRMAVQTGFFRGSLAGINDEIDNIMGNMNSLDYEWERIVSGNTLIAQNELFRASLKDVDTDIINLSGSFQGVDNDFATTVMNVIHKIREWENQIDFLKQQQELFPGDYEIWENELNRAIGNMNIDILTLKAYMEDLGVTFSSDLPLDIDYLASYFTGTLSGMSSNTSVLQSQLSNLIFDYQTLQELAGNNPLQNLSQYGIFSQEQIEAAVGQFVNLSQIQETVLKSNDSSYISNYLRDLEALLGPLKNTEFYNSLQRLISQIQGRLKDFQMPPPPGDLLPFHENEPEPDNQNQNNGSLSRPSSYRRSSYQPIAQPQLTPQAPQEVYCLYIENMTIQGTDDLDQEARQLLEIWRRDKGHFKTEVIEYIKRKINAQSLL